MIWMAAAMAASAIAKFAGDSANAKAQKKIQRYKNKMTNLAAAMSMNSITENEAMAVQQSARQAVAMRRDEMSTLGSTAVAAAAAGVKGNSVNLSVVDVQRNAGRAERDRQIDLEQQFLQFQQQRQSTVLSAAQGQDISYIPRPNFLSYALQAAPSVMSAYGKGGS